MSGHNFNFPPPPPAPPKASQSHLEVSQPFGGPDGYRRRETRGDHCNRGHGRGFNQAGRRRHYGSSQTTPEHRRLSLGVDNRHSSSSNMGYNVDTNGHRRVEHPLPSYPSLLPQHRTSSLQDYGQQIPAFSVNDLPPEASYPSDGECSFQNYNRHQQHSSHDYGPSPSTIQASLPAAQNSNSLQTNAHAGRPVLMGPPIRMGFDARRNGHQAQQYPMPTANRTNTYWHGLSNGNDSPNRYSSPMGFPSSGHQFPNPFLGYRGQGLKRGHGEAFYRSRNRNHPTQVSPAVPSFGSSLPFPMKPPGLHETFRRPKKKMRKENQLGLTPKAEDHKSSEEEDDDADEEAKLAAVAASAGQCRQLLQFEYKGRTSTLQSSSDITAWIKERKKRFPTQARAAEIAEGKRQRDEQQTLTKQIRKENQEKHQTKVRERQTEKREGGQQPERGKKTSEDVAAESKRKVEKLRKQLKKEEKRIAKAEAKASKDEIEFSAKMDRADGPELGNTNEKRKRSPSGAPESVKIEDTKRVKLELVGPASAVANPLTPTSQPASADEGRNSPSIALNADGASGQVNASTVHESDGFSFPDMNRSIQNSSVSMFDSSPDSSSTDSEEITSSSGSSSDADDDDEAPDETSTRRNGLERVAPSEHTKSKQKCRIFLNRGLCKRGGHCRYLHEIPEKGSRRRGSPKIKRAGVRTERVGLYQRLVEREKEQEDQEIVEAILDLGGRGVSSNERARSK